MRASNDDTEETNETYDDAVTLVCDEDLRAAGAVGKDENNNYLYSICRKIDDGKEMVQCEECKLWFHCECINFLQSSDGVVVFLCAGREDNKEMMKQTKRN